MSQMRVLVTGGTSGIGKSIVERLCGDRHAVAFTGRSRERGALVAAATGATFLYADLADPASGETTAAQTAAAFGGVDALVHNAGVDHEGPLSQTTDDAWDTLVEVNLLAALRQVQGALPHLRASPEASITIVSSDAGLWPEVGVAAYSVVKRAVLMLGQMLAVTSGADGIRVNVVCPGDIAPGMRSTASGYGATGDVSDWYVPPLGRIGEPDDVAGAVAFLLSTDAAFCTGVALPVDGGMRASTAVVDRECEATRP